MKLNATLKSLICEIASIDSVQSAVNGRSVAIINYDGDEPGGKGIREIEPVALGKSKAGNLVVRAWDREGSSHTAYKGEQPLPGWRLFRLDKILSFKPTGEIYNQIRPGYNLNGDKSMTSVITIAKFDNTSTQGPTPPQQNV
jgi:predicted DNA-binding transcriptional regulator YafY